MMLSIVGNKIRYYDVKYQNEEIGNMKECKEELNGGSQCVWR